MIVLLTALLIHPVDTQPDAPHTVSPCVFLPQPEVWLCPPGIIEPSTP